MAVKPNPPSGTDIVAAARRARAEREAGYRERALKLFPHVCARCGREFAGKRLRELTVHHKDHDHDHNPPDGSNWELLCLYCHDNEHGRDQVAASYAPEGPAAGPAAAPPPPLDSPFAGLAEMLRRRREGSE